jgi:hypothetical protein
MGNVDDHGLEVLKKAAQNLDPTSKKDYALQTLDSTKFAVPAGADAFSRECIGNTEVYKFRSGGIAGTVLKTITLYYQAPQDPSFVGGELTT